MNKPEIAFILSVQDLIANEIIIAEKSKPMDKYKLNQVYNRINGFLNKLKGDLK